MTRSVISINSSLISLSRYTRATWQSGTQRTPGCSSSPGLPKGMKTARPQDEQCESNAPQAQFGSPD